MRLSVCRRAHSPRRPRRSVPLATALIIAALGVSRIVTAGVDVWTAVGPPGVRLTAAALDPNTPGTIYAGSTDCAPTCQGGRIFKSTDGGRTWAEKVGYGLGGYVNTLVIAPGGSTIYAGGGSGVSRSTDNGDHWTFLGLNGSASVYAIAIDPQTPSTLYAGKSEDYVGCGGPCLFKSINGGNSWDSIETVPALNTGIVAIVIDPSRSETVYALPGFYERPFKSTDGGSTWISLETGSIQITSLAIDPRTKTTLYAGSIDLGLLKSLDAGASWRPLPLPLPFRKGVTRVAVDPTSPGTVYTATYVEGEGEVFRSVDGGESWISIRQGLNAYLRALVVDPTDSSRLYAVTYPTVTSLGLLMEYQISPLRIPGPCAPDPRNLCLGGGRFEVAARWTDAAGAGGAGRAAAVTADAGYFTFFGASNVELLVKVVDGCGFNGHFWTFAGGLTNLSVSLTVRDTKTGAVKVYFNPPNSPFETIQDTATFPCSASALSSVRVASSIGTAPPPPIASDRFLETTSRQTATCVADGVSLCLSDARYRVTARWTAPDGSTGDARSLTLTADAGAFWFFTPENPELVVKVLDGCAVNSRSWVFAAGLTNVEVVLTVTDTQTGVVRSYINPQGTPFRPIQDTDAFTNCP